MALFFVSSGFHVSSIPLHRSPAILKTAYSETLSQKTVTLKASKSLTFSSVNPHYTILPIFRCSTSSDYSVEDERSPSSRIFIKGLPQSTTEGRLVKTFSCFGKVDRVKIVTDKKCRQSLGFAYVWFTNEESAQIAMEQMDGKFFDGRFIIVAIAKPESPTTQVRATPYKF